VKHGPRHGGRRRLVAGAGAALAAAAWPGPRPRAQPASPEPLTDFLTGGEAPKRGRVHLTLPILIENGNSVPMKVTVDSPMTAADHVTVIHLVSERNPVRLMASFHLGPRSGRAEVQSRVRLAGSQKVVALARMSDGSYWYDAANTVVTLSACVDESGPT